MESFKGELAQKIEMARNLQSGGQATADLAKEQWEEICNDYLQLAGLSDRASIEGIEYRKGAVATAFEAGGKEKAAEVLSALMESSDILPGQFEELKTRYL